MDLKIPGINEIKGRLGFKDAGVSVPRAQRSSQPRHADYGDFDHEDFGEYAFDDAADYAQAPKSATSASQTGSFSAQMPKLVTADDVRAHTQYTPPEDDPQATRPNRELSFMRENAQRSEGLNSLFEASEPAAAGQASETGAYNPSSASAPSAADAPIARPVVEPRVAPRATRILSVIKPESYAEAERIAKILKSGDVAVLALRNTPEALGKRILDFSFGVACALDARVECVSGHVFAITRGAGLTEGEATRLRDQGLM